MASKRARPGELMEACRKLFRGGLPDAPLGFAEAAKQCVCKNYKQLLLKPEKFLTTKKFKGRACPLLGSSKNPKARAGKEIFRGRDVPGLFERTICYGV